MLRRINPVFIPVKFNMTALAQGVKIFVPTVHFIMLVPWRAIGQGRPFMGDSEHYSNDLRVIAEQSEARVAVQAVDFVDVEPLAGTITRPD